MKCTSSLFSTNVVFSIMISFGLSTAAQAKKDTLGGNRYQVEMMFYNTLNLFDATHDAGKNDYTFLPQGAPGKDAYCKTVSNSHWREECEKSNWTEQHFRLKLKQINKALTIGRTQLPDMIGLCEVENEFAVQELAKVMGFEHAVATDSPDRRGIDVGLMFNEKEGLKYVGYEEYVIDFGTLQNKPTRNLLEVEFKLANKERLLVYVNHWPSQGAPATVRQMVARNLMKIVNEQMIADPTTNVVLMGDFNVIPQDFPHPFHTELLSYNYKTSFKDVGSVFRKDGRIPSAQKRALSFGTYFFVRDMTWNQLDHFFVNKKLTDQKGAEAIISSFNIHAPKMITTDFTYDDKTGGAYGTKITNVPKKYDIYTLKASEAGFSDHFPIQMSLSIPRK